MKSIMILFIVFGLNSVLMADAYTKCEGCHGQKGELEALKKSKPISKMTKAEIVASLKGYRDGTYGDSMKGLMVVQIKELSDEDIQEIANKIGK